MERVLIVAKTRMHGAVCVSGLTRDTNSSIRLLRPDRSNQSINTSFDIGQVWELEFHQSPQITPPHVEDVIVIRERYIGPQTNLRTILMQRVNPWQGEPGQLFDGILVIDNTKGYISKSTGIPKSSTGYWFPNRPLTLTYRNEKPYYQIKYDIYNDYQGTLSIPYVGFAEPIQQIPVNTLVRVSLARWWVPTGVTEERCYLQLSGWHL